MVIHFFISSFWISSFHLRLTRFEEPLESFTFFRAYSIQSGYKALYNFLHCWKEELGFANLKAGFHPKGWITFWRWKKFIPRAEGPRDEFFWPEECNLSRGMKATAWRLQNPILPDSSVRKDISFTYICALISQKFWVEELQNSSHGMNFTNAQM